MSKSISDSVAQSLLSALRGVHAAVSENAEVKPWDECDLSDLASMCRQAVSLLRGNEDARKAERLDPIRELAAECAAPYLQAAREAKAQYDNLPEAVRSAMPAFSASVKVPLSAFDSCFDESVSAAQRVRDLRALYPSVGAPAKDASHINIPLEPKASK